jgi:hypothetical protein
MVNITGCHIGSAICTSFKRANMPRSWQDSSAIRLVSLRPRKSSLAASSLHAKPTPRAWLNFGYWHKTDQSPLVL